MNKPQVVAVFGEIGAGKSTLAHELALVLDPVKIGGGPGCYVLLEDLREMKIEAPIYGFTRPIKEHVKKVCELVKGDRGWRKAIHDAARILPPGEHETSTPIRDFNGAPHTAWHRLAEELWLKLWERRFAETFPSARWIIVDDARTEYEFAEAKRRGWITILVTGRRRHSFLHPDYWLRTERSVRRLHRRHRREERAVVNDRRAPDLSLCFDYVVDNGHGLGWLRDRARDLANSLKEMEALTPALSHGERENDKEES